MKGNDVRVGVVKQDAQNRPSSSKEVRGPKEVCGPKEVVVLYGLHSRDVKH